MLLRLVPFSQLLLIFAVGVFSGCKPKANGADTMRAVGSLQNAGPALGPEVALKAGSYVFPTTDKKFNPDAPIQGVQVESGWAVSHVVPDSVSELRTRGFYQGTLNNSRRDKVRFHRSASQNCVYAGVQYENGVRAPSRSLNCNFTLNPDYSYLDRCSIFNKSDCNKY